MATANPAAAMLVRRSRTRFRAGSSAFAAYGFLAPTVGAILLGFVLPAIDIVRRSATDGTIADDGSYVGLGNYVQLFTSGEFWNSLRVTSTYAVATAVGTLAFGLLAASILNRSFRGRGVFRTLLIIPWAMPLVPVALVWQWMLDPQYGVIRAAWTGMSLGDFPSALTDPTWALPTVIVVQIWRYVPFAALMYLAGMQSISPELYEAAKTDGAGWFRLFTNVTLPGLRNITIVLTLLITIWSFGTAMTIVLLLTNGGPNGSTNLLSLYSYSQAFSQYRFGMASAIGTVVLVLSGLFAAAYLLVTRSRNGR